MKNAAVPTLLPAQVASYRGCFEQGGAGSGLRRLEHGLFLASLTFFLSLGSSEPRLA